MLFQVGSYTHPANEVNVTSFTQQRVASRRGGPDYIRKTLSIEGVLTPSSPTQASIRAAIQQLESQYASTVVSGDVGLLHDDGLTQSPHFLDSSASETGVKLVSLNYPRGDAAEYATGRTFAAVFQADYADAGGSGVLFWQDTVTVSGNGGPRQVLVEVDSGVPVLQTVSTNTPVFATQSGISVGRNNWLSVAPPLWPTLEVGWRRQIGSTTPNRRNGAIVEYSRRWSYQFQSPTNVFGTTTPAVV